MTKYPIIIAVCCALLASCQRPALKIEASGTIEAVSVRVSAKSTGEILKLSADEGSRVKKGAELALIDHSILDIQLAQAKAGADLSRAQLELLANGARAEDLAQAEDALTQAGELSRSAQEDFQRTQSLYTQGAASKKQRDDAETRATTTKAQASAADQALKKLINFARPEDLKAAKARLDQAVYSVRLLEKAVKDCTVMSPADGVVTERLVEEGELVMPGAGLYMVTNLDTLKLTIYVAETDLGDIRLGQEAAVSIDSRPGSAFSGKVVYISPDAEFTPRDVQTKDERVKLVFAVRIEIANPEGIFKPGMPADATLQRAGSIPK
jgi:HlyD family secretion protein